MEVRATRRLRVGDSFHGYLSHMAERDPNKLADALDDDADKLERHSNEVQQQIDDARQDWERKRRDENVPGAPPPGDADEQSPIGAEEQPPPEARREG